MGSMGGEMEYIPRGAELRHQACFVYNLSQSQSFIYVKKESLMSRLTSKVPYIHMLYMELIIDCN